MLSELHVRQFALIEDVQLDLAGGMTVFSGETGAGKSMLVDALGAAFGARASSDWVRHGFDKAEVSAVLLDAEQVLSELLDELDLENSDDGTLVLRRVIRADGSSRAYVNGSLVPAKALQDIGRLMLDMHGQHEHQSLMRPEFQRGLVDAAIPVAMKESMAAAWRNLLEQRAALAYLLESRQRSVREEVWIREECARLKALELYEGVVEELQQQVDAGRNFAQINDAAAQALNVLEEEDGDVRSRLAGCVHALQGVAEFRPEIGEAVELLNQVDALLGEAAPALRRVLDDEYDAAALQASESRLMDLHEAMRRNQTDEAGLIALHAELEDKLSRLDTGAWDEDAQKLKLAEAQTEFLALSAALAEARAASGRQLVQGLRPFLDRLALAGMQLDIVVNDRPDDEAVWGAHGSDTLSFMAASNPGEPFRELAAVASGGEMSRLVLALKGCGAMRVMPQIAVFDEVDTGIGGETAWCVGELLSAMGEVRQVLVISHLPQVAACAAQQVHIFKEQKNGRTVSALKVLNAEARQEELARMLGGSNERSLEHAMEMLARGAQQAPESAVQRANA
ncbi:MAG: DNA repair protein RecN [Zetaproteobacteria bacterium CG06_land_8_20_14_3_00_59_53]|nr:MAG: DNA repair protein RecN [Zetaproteobacteria bacterium CG2_30_59_37]PIO89170.1 MAG: DNA repair protein RecN [Zetaproteobacteria bacterium CG23_combo_of_CG06-09_8_20_14_all_59_86]PIQ64481.1 MAG: DNA repair protein RecN [Zetaproteobacteria bacterium CG11_big_fil_rev_8_21_14_0_20_59_439]PIU70908.1 MAG: DNA repair protein RecN [Zetaproteobacteria bacterium CG06_land_8_20_14_3_00_59_53]PIU96347.1 MAG: DNA repair protein RecN [Zetaproteobacteria bacterium CG03_land_8_20_14_0_80_59_51]PIY45187